MRPETVTVNMGGDPKPGLLRDVAYSPIVGDRSARAGPGGGTGGGRHRYGYRATRSWFTRCPAPGEAPTAPYSAAWGVQRLAAK